MSGRKLLLVAALVAGLALANQVRPLNVLAYSLLATLALSWLWSWASVRGVALRRELRQTRAQVGEHVEERLTLRNQSLLPRLWLELADHSTLAGHAAGRVVDLAPGASRTWLVRTLCRRRGEYVVGPATLVSADPLGLFPARRWLPEARRLLVLPATVGLPGLQLPAASLLGGLRPAAALHQSTPHAAEVREYHPGDPLNRIHWPSTARTNRLMVKEFDRDPTADVWLFLDLEEAAHVGPGDADGDDDSEELGVCVAASLARHCLEQGRSVGLVATGARLDVLPADRGDRQLLKLLEELAVVRADGTAPLAEVIAAEAGRCGHRAVALAITPSLDERWVGALRLLALQGTPAAAVFLDPSSFGPSEPDAGALPLLTALAAAGLPAYVLRRGDRLDQALRGDGRPRWAGAGGRGPAP